MTRRGWLPALVLGVIACSSDGAGPQVGGETNWLVRCSDDEACGTLSCLCRVCASACDNGCGDGAVCFRPEDDLEAGLCAGDGANAVAGLCVPTCDRDEDCPGSARCRAGACLPIAEPDVAFPGAVGFGAGASGGRFGEVRVVDQLGADGPGSLQAAIDAPGARIVVFAVSGVVEAPRVLIEHGDLTIAGESAPGGGITLRGRLYADAAIDNVVIRHLRIRPEYDGSEVAQFDALRMSNARNVMLDHVSVAFGVDETVDLFSAVDVTLQHSSVELAMGGSMGVRDAGLIVGPEGSRISLVGNLFAHLGIWSPGIASGPAEVVGNLVFDAQTGFMHGNPAAGPFNLIGNHFEAGPTRELTPFYFDDTRSAPADDLAYYMEGNALAGDAGDCTPGPMDDPWSACAVTQPVDASHRVTEAHDFSGASPAYRPPAATTASDARTEVPTSCGAFPRDVVTRGVLADLAQGVGVDATDYPEDYLEGLSPSAPPEDRDRDGMADAWERAHGLDPDDASDHRVQLEGGYSAIEAYLQELAAALAP